MDSRRCKDCGHDFPISLTRCPHCARPGLFPNVAMAELESEKLTLQNRYQSAVEDAAQRGREETVRAFEDEASRSKAVIARSYGETMRLASGDHNLYGSYHQLIESDLRVPEGSKWDLLRSLTDETLFGPYKKEIRFAALSLDGLGITRYGDCSWVLRDDMIAHRASVFEENSVMFMDRRQMSVSRGVEVPSGHRATWSERAKLCVAKLAAKITDKISRKAFSSLLLSDGRSSEEDDFVEVHVGGPITVRTLERVIVKRGARRHTMVKALRAKLEGFGVEMEGRAWKH